MKTDINACFFFSLWKKYFAFDVNSKLTYTKANYLLSIAMSFKVTAAAEQSYSYYTGNDGTDKDPQVVDFQYTMN